MVQGKRYDSDGHSHLNMKKVFSLIVAIVVIIMVIISMQNLLVAKPSVETKIVDVQYYPVYTNEKWGVIDTNGDIVISPIYDEMVVVPNSEKPVFICTYDVNISNNSYKIKVLNEKNERIFTEYDSVTVLDNHDKNNSLWYEKGILKVEKYGKYGIINYDGKEIIKCEYDEITALNGISNVLYVKKDGVYGVMSSIGTTIINPEYKSIEPLGEKQEYGYIVETDEGYGVALSNRKVIVTPKYEEIKKVYGNDMYFVKEDNEWKVINKIGETVLSSGFDDVIEISNNNITILKDNKYGVISTSGENIIPTEYDYVKYAFDNYFIVEKDGKYGVVDINNDIKLGMKYTNISYRGEVNFLEADNERFETEVYDKNLNLKLTGIISEVNIEDGYIRIWQNDDYKYYNFKFEPKSNIEVLKGKTLYLSKSNGKYGYIDRNGNVIVNYQYEDAKEQNEYGFCAIKLNGKWGVIDRNGRTILDAKYELKSNTKIDFIGKWHLGRDLNMNYYTDIDV